MDNLDVLFIFFFIFFALLIIVLSLFIWKKASTNPVDHQAYGYDEDYGYDEALHLNKTLTETNPATGLFMVVPGAVDIEGNPYGVNLYGVNLDKL